MLGSFIQVVLCPPCVAGEGNDTFHLFVPGWILLGMLPLWAKLLHCEEILSRVHAPGGLQIVVCMLCISRLFAYLLSKSNRISSEFHPSCNHWLLQLSGTIKNSADSASVTPKPNAMGILFLMVSLCVSMSLALLHSHVSLWWQQSGSISLPSHVSALPTLVYVVSSLPSVVEFVLPVFRFSLGWGCLGWFDRSLVVLMGGGEPKVFLLHHHLLKPQSLF